LARIRRCVDPSGLSRSPERPCLHYVVVPSPIRQNFLPAPAEIYAAGSNLGSLKPLPTNHYGPGHACHFVGESDGGTLAGSGAHQAREPVPLRAMLSCISDHSHGAGDEQPSQMSIALFGDPAKSVLAAGRMLLGHQPDPRGETAARGERLPISNFGH